MTTYYTLVLMGDSVGWQIGTDDAMAVNSDPRRLPAANITDGYPGADSIADLAKHWQVAAVEPIGTITDLGDGYFEADDWTVIGNEPIGLFLGPQAELVLAAIETGEKELNVKTTPGSPQEIFHKETDAQYELDLDGRVHAYLTAVEDALGDAGYWWVTAAGVDYGNPILALAARDLIGTTETWIWEAYDFLTDPWVAALGPIHPDDAQRLAETKTTPGTEPRP